MSRWVSTCLIIDCLFEVLFSQLLHLNRIPISSSFTRSIIDSRRLLKSKMNKLFDHFLLWNFDTSVVFYEPWSNINPERWTQMARNNGLHHIHIKFFNSLPTERQLLSRDTSSNAEQAPLWSWRLCHRAGKSGSHPCGFRRAFAYSSCLQRSCHN